MHLINDYDENGFHQLDLFALMMRIMNTGALDFPHALTKNDLFAQLSHDK